MPGSSRCAGRERRRTRAAVVAEQPIEDRDRRGDACILHVTRRHRCQDRRRRHPRAPLRRLGHHRRLHLRHGAPQDAGALRRLRARLHPDCQSLGVVLPQRREPLRQSEGWSAQRITGPFTKDGFYGLGGVTFHGSGGRVGHLRHRRHRRLRQEGQPLRHLLPREAQRRRPRDQGEGRRGRDVLHPRGRRRGRLAHPLGHRAGRRSVAHPPPHRERRRAPLRRRARTRRPRRGVQRARRQRRPGEAPRADERRALEGADGPRQARARRPAIRHQRERGRRLQAPRPTRRRWAPSSTR